MKDGKEEEGIELQSGDAQSLLRIRDANTIFFKNEKEDESLCKERVHKFLLINPKLQDKETYSQYWKRHKENIEKAQELLQQADPKGQEIFNCLHELANKNLDKLFSIVLDKYHKFLCECL
jgi:hypothetical protein